MKILKLVTMVLPLILVACATPVTPTVAPPTEAQNSVAPTERLLSSPTHTPLSNTPTRFSTKTTVPPSPTTVPPTATATPLPATDPTTSLGELTNLSSAGWAQFVTSIRADAANAQTRVNTFWSLAVQARRVPLILSDGVVFLYKGDAQSVVWSGDFSFWQPETGIPGKRVGNTDLWYGIANFPRDSRTDYEIYLNNSQLVLDPANPDTDKSGIGLGANSVLTMPDFRVTDFTKPRTDVPHGTLTAWIPLDSQGWGASINYRVYTPPHYKALNHLAVLYVTDGSDFSDPEVGGVQTVIDNLMADGKITPLIAVFIDAHDPKNIADNQRNTQFLERPDDFAAFIAQELVPTIDAKYHTNPKREARALVGTSFGAAFATFAGLKYRNLFGNLVLFSPAYWVYDPQSLTGEASPETPAQRMGDYVKAILADPAMTLHQKVFLSVGIPDWDVGDVQSMRDAFVARGAEAKIFHSQEGHSWHAWAGLTDEMLEYLYAP